MNPAGEHKAAGATDRGGVCLLQPRDTRTHRKHRRGARAQQIVISADNRRRTTGSTRRLGALKRDAAPRIAIRQKYGLTQRDEETPLDTLGGESMRISVAGVRVRIRLMGNHFYIRSAL